MGNVVITHIFRGYTHSSNPSVTATPCHFSVGMLAPGKHSYPNSLRYPLHRGGFDSSINWILPQSFQYFPCQHFHQRLIHLPHIPGDPADVDQIQGGNIVG